MEVASRLRTLPLPGWRWCWSARGTSVAPPMQQQWWKHGSVGSLGARDGWTPDRTTQHEWMLGPIQEPEPNELWQDGWKTPGSRVDLCQRRASGVEVWRPSGAAPVARVNAITVLAGKGWTPAAKGQPQVTHPGRQSGHDVVLLILGAASLTWTFFGGHAVQCGVDGAASSSSNLTALNASEMVMAARTKQWRVQHFMENDDDFAYAFASYDQALLAGGHGLATEWLEVRARQEEHLVPAAAAVVAALRPGAPSRVHQHAPKPTAKPFARSRWQGVRLHENPGNSSQAVTHRVGVLANVFMQLGALRPTGSLTSGLQQEWTRACQRLSQQLVTQSEVITITNAVKTSQELQAHMNSRGRRGYPEFLDLDSFLHNEGGNDGPVPSPEQHQVAQPERPTWVGDARADCANCQVQSSGEGPTSHSGSAAHAGISGRTDRAFAQRGGPSLDGPAVVLAYGGGLPSS